MRENTTFETIVRQFLTPIIQGAIGDAIAKYSYLNSERTATVPEIINIRGAANFLGLSIPTVYYYTHKRLIPHYKIGKRLFFRKSDLEQWILSGKIKPIDEIKQDVGSYLAKKRK